MRRRASLLALLALAGSLPVAVSVAAGSSRRVVLFFGGTSAAADRHRKVVSDRLATHGFSASNLSLDVHRGGIEQWNLDTASRIAAMKPDVILVESTRLASALAQVKATMPVVFSGVDDPVQAGLVKSFARPGANMTGVYYSQLEVAAKRLELLRELLPRASRVAIAASFGDSGVRHTMPVLVSIASRLGLKLLEMDGTWNFGFEGGLDLVARENPDAVVILQPHAFYGMEDVLDPILRFGVSRRIPVLCWESQIAERGALLSYGVNLTHELTRAADQVARVLKGESPANLPVDQATLYELVVNRRTARQIGLSVAPSLLVRADRLID